MKTRLDMPHLEPLRYDYRLLREAYTAEPRPNPRSGLVLASMGLFCVIIGVLGIWGVL